MWMRVPFVAAVSFGSMIIISSMRGEQEPLLESPSSEDNAQFDEGKLEISCVGWACNEVRDEHIAVQGL